MLYRQTVGRLLVAASLITPWSAHAFFPFLTDDTGTQGTGGNQVEIIFEHAKEHDALLDLDDRVIGSQASSINLVPASWTYGVTEDLDVFVGVVRQISRPHGWLNTELGLKWVFWGDQSQGWSAAIKPALLAPVTTAMQDRGLGNARTNGAITLIGSYMAPSYELHLNVNYTGNSASNAASDDSEKKHIWSVSVAPIYVLSDRWKAGFDLGLQTNPGDTSRLQAVASLGVQYAATENLQLGFGVLGTSAINASQKSWSYAITTGMTYQF